MAPTLCYYGTEFPVQIGDRILVRRLFRRARLATVVYIPGQSSPDPELRDDQWAYKTDDGAIYAVGYFPAEVSRAAKGIEFVSRPGNEAEEVIRSYKIPPEEPGQPGRDFLALIGCAVLAIIAVILVPVAISIVWQLFSK
jgi:hypothetical protein